MRHAALIALLVVLGFAGHDATSGADFTASSQAAPTTYTTAASFSTVTVTLANPGTPLQGPTALSATASSSLPIASVRFQRSPAGAGNWTDVCTSYVAPYGCTWATGSVADGAYDLRATATDAGGYTRTDTVSNRVVDNDGPAVTLTAPATSHLQGTASFTATATDSIGVAGVGIEYRATGAAAWTRLCTAAAAAWTCALDTTARADGDVDLRAVATDTGGHTAVSAVTVRRVDNTAPTTTLTDPGLMHGSVSLAATAADGAGTGVSTVALQYRPNGGTAWTTICTASSSPWGCTWSTGGVADGLYDLRAVATDGTGLTGTSALLTRRVDNTAPSVVTLAGPGTPLKGSVTLTGTATDLGSGVASWTVQYRAAGSSGAWSTACTSTSVPYTCSWATGGAADGLYDVRALAADAAGNTTPSATVANRRLDNNGPTVSLADPGSPLRGTVALTATASDPAGVQSVAIQRRPAAGGAWTTICTATTAPYTCSLNTTTLADGAYDLQALATDTTGNPSTALVASRTVDNTAPAPTNVQALNGTGTAGRMEAGDVLVFSFSEPLQPGSVLSGWSGAATAVTVRVLNTANADQITVYNAAGTAQSALTAGGPVVAKKLVSADTVFAATLSASGNDVRVTLGAMQSGAVITANPATLSWTAAAGFLDLAGNASAAATLSGTASTTPF